jgi:hypothetical protein
MKSVLKIILPFLKRTPLLGVGGLFLGQPAFSQKQDTIFVNVDATTYLIFDEAISLFNLGSKEYEAKVDNPKMLFLKAKYPNAKLSTIVLTHGEEIYTAYLAIKANQNAFYDFRKSVKTKIEPKENAEKLKRERLQAQLKKLAYRSSNLSIIAKKQQIRLELNHLFNDNEATYLKLTLENQSSILYDLDYVSFTYFEKRRRKDRKKNTVNAGFQEVETLIKIENSLTEAGKSNAYFYALPLYATTEKGYLQIIFREKAGLRSVTLNVPFKTISSPTSPLVETSNRPEGGTLLSR